MNLEVGIEKNWEVGLRTIGAKGTYAPEGRLKYCGIRRRAKGIRQKVLGKGHGAKGIGHRAWGKGCKA